MAGALDSQWCSSQATWRQRRRFQEEARRLIRLPEPQEDPQGVLLSEAAWRRLVPPGEEEEILLAALSQDTGIYFFPSQEWVAQCCRFLRLLGIRRVLEAGAGRGYLAAALAPRLAQVGIALMAVDSAQGEFESGLPRHPLVQLMAAQEALRHFQPDLVLYAWPPPGQSMAPLSSSPGVRYVLVVGEQGGGCTGDPNDWQHLRQRRIASLSRLGVGRSGRRRQAVTLFLGAGQASGT